MVSERSCTDSHILSLFDVAVFNVVDQRVPYLSAVINHSNLALVLVDFEKLNDLDLHVKVKALFSFSFWLPN